MEHLRVDVYGAEVELRTIAGLSVPEARLLVISPYDKTSIQAIEKAIQASDLGINPSNDGTVIRLAFPPLTEERRKELVKVVKHKAEEGRVAMRNLRRTARHELESLEHDGDISSDERRALQKKSWTSSPKRRWPCSRGSSLTKSTSCSSCEPDTLLKRARCGRGAQRCSAAAGAEEATWTTTRTDRVQRSTSLRKIRSWPHLPRRAPGG